ncbi:YmfQ family protein [Oceanibacterium hippocampi]|uniref:Uncharacterized protein n=1 Tax=Oceanibacterium hippocampi TaxID=745714 RepID=A0A1Y5TZP9_9PROT|nr:putative phage tail protein [Oceanibacterium hippocampi]SLN77628.1 hypothetical protein OCH7691_04485 [Oceanibacterium hippocampi]
MTAIVPRLEADAYARMLRRLLPEGLAWPAAPDSVLGQLLAGLAGGLARVHNRGVDLAEEALPTATRELLPDWERVAGLPDPCTPAGSTAEERRLALLARLRARGGQSAAYFTGLAGDLGYAIAITEYRPFVAGLGRAGDPLSGGHAVRHVWSVTVSEPRLSRFRCGLGRAGERLLTIRRAEDLECVLRRLGPAHMLLLFDYREPDTTPDGALMTEGGLPLATEGGAVLVLSEPWPDGALLAEAGVPITTEDDAILTMEVA